MVRALFGNRSAVLINQRSSCMTGGISISPAFVVMFVMEHFRLSCDDALHMVQNRRYCISPNGGFLSQIKARIHGNILLDMASKSLCYRSMRRYTAQLWP